jgi:hypothetical protein
MSTGEIDPLSEPPEPGPGRSNWRLPLSWRERTDLVSRDTALGQVIVGLRWGLFALYVIVVYLYWDKNGVPFDRTSLLVWVAIGIGILSLGYNPVWLLWILVDFFPFVAVLIVYDQLRGWSYTAGFPTWWHPQIEVDKFLFFGTEPTVWLQRHLKYPTVQWWDVGVCICYFSFFFIPYLLAAVMWLRSRADFYRWAVRFVGLSFIGFGLFVLIPSAPPWAAARCSAAEIANHPNNPPCLGYVNVNDGILGHYGPGVPGTHNYVDAGIAVRGFSKLHLTVAQSLVDEGRHTADAVAAVPSLHVGGTVLFVLFMWPRVNKWWRALLALYPFAMMFSLAYGAEHYVADGIAGALCAWLVHWLANRGERWLKGGAPTDTLDLPPDSDQESACPPTATPNLELPLGETPSST